MESANKQSINNLIDGIFVLTVKSFHQRIAHIKKQFALHDIAFEFIYKYDIDEIKPETKEKMFGPSDMEDKHISLVLKHIEALRIAEKRGLKRILVFEDDVIIDDDFVLKIKKVVEETENIKPGYLVFLGGSNTKAPLDYFLSKEVLYPLPIATAEGYLTDIDSIKKRLVWIENNKITLPADHLLRFIDENVGNQQFWLRHPIVYQGSVTGIFDSVLDGHRQKHNKVFNQLRFYWTHFKRRIFMNWLAKAYHLFHLGKV